MSEQPGRGRRRGPDRMGAPAVVAVGCPGSGAPDSSYLPAALAAPVRRAAWPFPGRRCELGWMRCKCCRVTTPSSSPRTTDARGWSSMASPRLIPLLDARCSLCVCRPRLRAPAPCWRAFGSVLCFSVIPTADRAARGGVGGFSLLTAGAGLLAVSLGYNIIRAVATSVVLVRPTD